MSEKRTGTGKVVVNRCMSIDAFIAGSGDAMTWIFEFMEPNQLLEMAAATGAMLVGRRTDEVGGRMDANHEKGGASSARATPSPGRPLSSPTGRRTRPIPVSST